MNLNVLNLLGLNEGEDMFEKIIHQKRRTGILFPPSYPGQYLKWSKLSLIEINKNYMIKLIQDLCALIVLRNEINDHSKTLIDSKP